MLGLFYLLIEGAVTIMTLGAVLIILHLISKDYEAGKNTKQ